MTTTDGPRLSGCTCGGIGTTGAHRVGCPWGRTVRARTTNDEPPVNDATASGAGTI
jgi:hypothetical protein